MEYCVAIRMNDIESIWADMETCPRCIVMLKKSKTSKQKTQVVDQYIEYDPIFVRGKKQTHKH